MSAPDEASVVVDLDPDRPPGRIVVDPAAHYTVEGLAHLLHRRPQTLLNRRSEGRSMPPGFVVAGRLIFPGAGIIRWLGGEPPTPPPSRARPVATGRKLTPDDVHEIRKALVGTDIQPGTYRATVEDDIVALCTWQRLSGLSGESDDVITIDLATEARAQAVVEINRRCRLRLVRAAANGLRFDRCVSDIAPAVPGMECFGSTNRREQVMTVRELLVTNVSSGKIVHRTLKLCPHQGHRPVQAGRASVRVGVSQYQLAGRATRSQLALPTLLRHEAGGPVEGASR